MMSLLPEDPFTVGAGTRAALTAVMTPRGTGLERLARRDATT